MTMLILSAPTTSSNINNKNHSTLNVNNIKILNNAADYYYSPFKLEYETKIVDKKKGVKMVNELVNHIRNDFLRANSLFSAPILGDLCWIDFEDNLQMIINKCGTSDLNPRVMCTSKSKKQVTLVATTRLTLD